MKKIMIHKLRYQKRNHVISNKKIIIQQIYVYLMYYACNKELYYNIKN